MGDEVQYEGGQDVATGAGVTERVAGDSRSTPLRRGTGRKIALITGGVLTGMVACSAVVGGGAKADTAEESSQATKREITEIWSTLDPRVQQEVCIQSRISPDLLHRDFVAGLTANAGSEPSQQEIVDLVTGFCGTTGS